MRILKSYGTDGGVLVNLSDIPEDLNLNEPATVVIDGLPVPFFVEEVRAKGSRAVVKFEDVDSLQQSEALVGKDFFFPGEPGSCWVSRPRRGGLAAGVSSDGSGSAIGIGPDSGSGCWRPEAPLGDDGGSDEASLSTIVGFTVIDASDGTEYGVISDWYDIPGNPCIEVSRPSGEGKVLVPFHEDLIADFRPRKKLISIRIPVGL